jgi:hypothetical protein
MSCELEFDIQGRDRAGDCIKVREPTEFINKLHLPMFFTDAFGEGDFGECS